MKKIKLLALLSILISSTMYSDIKLDASKLQNTTIEQGKKGNTIININTPNRVGISVNDFENFQTKNGVIFNNAGPRMNISQLEGIINGNPNIKGEQAKLILNRVNGTNRTEIEGAMEAVGRNKVDMIFSSPSGIYLDGAKFIGFKDVTFTTAPVNLDGEGNIQTLTIDKGNIEIGRKGLDASKLEQLALLSKQISIGGEVKGKSINLIAGDFDFNIKDKSYINKSTKNHGIVVSTSEFGSIYGEQINIRAFNGNLGINGDIIASKLVNLESLLANLNGNISSEVVGLDISTVNINGNISSKSIDINIGGGFYVNGSINIEETIEIYGHLEVRGIIESESDIIIRRENFTREGRNYGTIKGKNIIFYTESERGHDNRPRYFYNYGDIIAFDTLIVNTRIKNYSNILAFDLIFGRNSSSYRVNDDNSIENNKLLTVLNNVSVFRPASAQLFNKSNGTTEVHGNLGITTLENESIVNVEGDINVVNMNNKLNGIITSRNDIIVTNRNKSYYNSAIFRNSGVINSNNFTIDHILYSNKDYKGWAYNEGVLNINNKIFINMDHKIESNQSFFTNIGILNAGESIEIKIENLFNSGELNTKNLKLIFKDFSSQGGKITADKISFENYPE